MSAYSIRLEFSRCRAIRDLGQYFISVQKASADHENPKDSIPLATQLLKSVLSTIFFCKIWAPDLANHGKEEHQQHLNYISVLNSDIQLEQIHEQSNT